jgi:hypothetical protein
MANPTRYVADFTDQLPWIAEDIAKNLPRAAPETSMEAMMMARRNIPVDDSPLEMIRQRMRGLDDYGYERGRVSLPPSKTTWDDMQETMSESPGWARKVGRRLQYHTPQEWPVDPEALRVMRRQAMAEAYLDQARKNPEIGQMLPMGLQPGILPDKLLARLAAESPQVVLRKAIQDNPEIVGGLMGAGGAMGGGIAYGLLSDE